MNRNSGTRNQLPSAIVPVTEGFCSARLSALENIAPTVLSNCANSGIDIVGVLTQYESVLLNSYVAASRHWGLDSKDSGVFVLPPREKADADLDVYRGTADAISQNIDFIDNYSPEYLLILSGDHIYKMDYDKMLRYHKENKADATIAVLPVRRATLHPWAFTSSHGKSCAKSCSPI